MRGPFWRDRLWKGSGTRDEKGARQPVWFPTRGFILTENRSAVAEGRGNIGEKGRDSLGQLYTPTDALISNECVLVPKTTIVSCILSGDTVGANSWSSALPTLIHI